VRRVVVLLLVVLVVVVVAVAAAEAAQDGAEAAAVGAHRPRRRATPPTRRCRRRVCRDALQMSSPIKPTIIDHLVSSHGVRGFVTWWARFRHMVGCSRVSSMAIDGNQCSSMFINVHQ
jgi:hypothetical protein